MLKRDKEEIVFNERNILINVNHPFIIKLHYAFQTVHLDIYFYGLNLILEKKIIFRNGFLYWWRSVFPL